MSAHPTAEAMARDAGYTESGATYAAGIAAERARMVKHLREWAKALRARAYAGDGYQAAAFECEADDLESK